MLSQVISPFVSVLLAPLDEKKNATGVEGKRDDEKKGIKRKQDVTKDQVEKENSLSGDVTECTSHSSFDCEKPRKRLFRVPEKQYPWVVMEIFDQSNKKREIQSSYNRYFFNIVEFPHLESSTINISFDLTTSSKKKYSKLEGKHSYEFCRDNCSSDHYANAYVIVDLDQNIIIMPKVMCISDVIQLVSSIIDIEKHLSDRRVIAYFNCTTSAAYRQYEDLMRQTNTNVHRNDVIEFNEEVSSSISSNPWLCLIEIEDEGIPCV